MPCWQRMIKSYNSAPAAGFGRIEFPCPVPQAQEEHSTNCAGLLAQPAPLALFPNGFQAALMDAQAQAQAQPQQPPPPLPESSVPLQAPGERRPALSSPEILAPQKCKCLPAIRHATPLWSGVGAATWMPYFLHASSFSGAAWA